MSDDGESISVGDGTLSISNVEFVSIDLGWVLSIGVHGCCSTVDEQVHMLQSHLTRAREVGITSDCDAPFEHEPDGIVGTACTMRLAARRYREAESLLEMLDG